MGALRAGGLVISTLLPAGHGARTGIQDLRVGDTLIGEGGTPVQVNSIEPVNYGVRVYNITVAGNHTFFADGILVHNKGPNPEG